MVKTVKYKINWKADVSPRYRKNHFRVIAHLVQSILCRILFLLLFIEVPAQSITIDKKKFFTDEQIIEMTLVSDFKKLTGEKLNKDYATNFQPAMLTCVFPDSIKIMEPVEIRPRGEFRREECYIPSIMVNFKTPGASILKKLGRLKLVWPCSLAGYNEQLVLKEYLVYKIYNLLTDKSFRVRLVMMRYQDSREKIHSRKFYAFFIEDVDDMARRNDFEEVDPYRPHTEATNREQTTLLALFQYMIGNTDWAVPLYRNIKLIRSKKDSLSLPVAVPYDFDYCGLVNAGYAIPTPELEITSVQQRVYRGFSRTMEELQAALQLFRENKHAIDSLITNFEPLESFHKKSMRRYLDDFFELVENEKQIRSIFITNARKI